MRPIGRMVDVITPDELIPPPREFVMISGNAFSCGDLTWMKWMSTPSISVSYCASAFSLASHLRQS